MPVFPAVAQIHWTLAYADPLFSKRMDTLLVFANVYIHCVLPSQVDGRIEESGATTFVSFRFRNDAQA